MSSKRLYYTLLGVIGLLILGLFGGAYFTNKLLIAEAQTLKHNRLQAAVYAAETQQLDKAKADIRKYQDLAQIARSIVPQDKDQAQTVRQVVDIASAHSISLSSIAFPNSTFGSSLSAPSASGLKLSQLTPVKGISGVYDLALTVQSDATKPVPFKQFIDFLTALEHNRRTALISDISLQPNDKDRSTLSFSLVLNEYIKP